MITNFEIETADLTEAEISLIPILVRGLQARTKLKPVKAPEIVQGINERYREYGLKTKFSEQRLRKLCNVIRSQGILPLIATSAGYYVSSDPEEIKKQIQSMTERAEAIQHAADGLKKFL